MIYACSLNRMTSLAVDSVTTGYVYRADGMRSSSSTPSIPPRCAFLAHQSPLAAPLVEGRALRVEPERASCAPEGVEAQTLTKSGTNFALGDLRSYDAWENVRDGSQTGRPRGRYCANLGHVQPRFAPPIRLRLGICASLRDVEATGTSAIVSDYALGAGGIDAVSRTENGGAATVGYPYARADSCMSR